MNKKKKKKKKKKNNNKNKNNNNNNNNNNRDSIAHTIWNTPSWPPFYKKSPNLNPTPRFF